MRSTGVFILLLAVLAGLSLLLRPPLPLDETRYLAVAWEMWHSGKFLVPHLNGETYSQKPPLLFWLFQAGWSVFGVNGWWPRLIPMLAAMASLLLLPKLNRAGGGSQDCGRAAVAILFACLGFLAYANVLMFDQLMVCFTLIGYLGLAHASKGHSRGWIYLALSIGLGGLCKGPVILLYLLPPALLASRYKLLQISRLAWNSRLCLSLLAGAAMTLSWAIPAAMHGGPEYSDAIFWGQSAGRMQDSFSHARPLWWYVPIGIALLLPWSLWPRFWKSLCKPGADLLHRYMLISITLPLVLFSLMSGKQPHYLLPLLPLAALAAARGLSKMQIFQPSLPRGMIFFWPVFLLASMPFALPRMVPPMDLRELSEKLSELETQGHPLLHVGKYYGQFNFLGRLRQPIAVTNPEQVLAWTTQHPQGYVVLSQRVDRNRYLWREEILASAIHRQAYRSLEIALLPASAIWTGPDFAPSIQQADTLMHKRLQAKVGPGFSVAVASHGQVVWAQAYGYADLENQILADTQTQFRIGSVSKPLTAAGLMRLQQRGKLDLDAEIQKYVADFPVKEWPITLRQLAGHLAGIRHYRGQEFRSTRHYEQVSEGLEIFAADPLLHQPGSKFFYSSYGWNLISAAMEQASGTDFLRTMRNEVFKPLDLQQTVPDQVTLELPHRSRFYVTKSGVPWPAPQVDNSYKWAGGGFLSSPTDLVRFGLALLQPGYLNTDSLDTLFTSQKSNDGDATGYGIGWSLSQHPQYGRVWSHSGGSVGGVTQLRLYPDLPLVVAVTINNSDGPAAGMAMDLLTSFAPALVE
jgi:serine beta-lactamase-like protein LACTB, mitochondrial